MMTPYHACGMYNLGFSTELGGHVRIHGTDLGKVNHTAVTALTQNSVQSIQLPSWGKPFVSYPLFVLRNEITTRVTGERS